MLSGISFTFHSGFLLGEDVSFWHNQIISSLETISLVLLDPVKFHCFRARRLLRLVVGYEAWTGLTCVSFRGIVINQDFWPNFRLLRDLLKLHFLRAHRGLTLVDVLSKLVSIQDHFVIFWKQINPPKLFVLCYMCSMGRISKRFLVESGTFRIGGHELLYSRNASRISCLL